MNREEARNVIKRRMEFSQSMIDFCIKRGEGSPINWEQERDSCAIALTALAGWVRTTDRTPEPEEFVLATTRGGYYLVTGMRIIMNPDEFPRWTYLPPLPETAGAEGTKNNG